MNMDTGFGSRIRIIHVTLSSDPGLGAIEKNFSVDPNCSPQLRPALVRSILFSQHGQHLYSFETNIRTPVFQDILGYPDLKSPRAHG